MPTIHLVTTDNLSLLESIAKGVFDDPVSPETARAFLNEPNHVLVVATEGEGGSPVIGMAFGVIYRNVDEAAPRLWINEVGVSPAHRRQGVGKDLMRCLLGHARAHGCKRAWLATDDDNVAALALYASVGGATPASSPHVRFDL